MNRRFIEESFPIKEVSELSAKEKNIRHGHISTLHIWWARRPLAASRATGFSALIPAPKDIEKWNTAKEFIVDLSKWENSLNHTLINKAREEILKYFDETPPKVLDPFAGGGAIPLEALRLGCEVYAGDLNPVSVLILKCTLEYPQRYRKGMRIIKDALGMEHEDDYNPLLVDVKKWGNWILDRAKEEIGKFYPVDDDGSIPVGYIWARTIPCQNPVCGAEIPLMRQFWLAKKRNKKVSLYPYVKDGKVEFKVVGTGYEPIPDGFNPSKGTVSRAVATCPVCGGTIDANTTRRLFQEGRASQRMIAIVLHGDNRGKRYRLATIRDMEAFKQAEEYLKDKRAKLMEEWGIDPVPDEPITRVPVSFGVINVWVYGMNTWGDLFNSRQKLALVTFTEKVRMAYQKMIEEGYDEENAKVVVTYLALMLGKLEDWNSTLSVWRGDQERNEHVFNRQALPMVWDYGERNPFEGNLMSPKGVDSIIEHLTQILPAENNSTPKVTQASTTELSYPKNYFDAVFTDPPYYDNVPYSYLSDFFYVWLKRSIGELYPELFSTPLTPKKNEIVAYSHGEGGFEEGKRYFEEMLKKAFKEIHRVLKPNGIATIVYAHKSTHGWETLINSLLESGLVVTASWPIHTEMQARLRARESATLASSIYIVSRKMERKGTGFYNEVKDELKRHINKRLERLWQEGISGADFFISAIGSGIEVFGKYEKVMDFEGNILKADRMLEEVRIIVTEYAVRQILKNGFGEDITDLTRFYVLFRWSFGSSKVIFDEAQKLARSCGIDLSREWGRGGYIKKDAEFIKVLDPDERNIEDLLGSSELIDVLHHVLILWKDGKRNEMIDILDKSGFGKRDSFYRVAQAISETLPTENREKKLLDGFLAGRERLKQELTPKTIQEKFKYD